MQTTGIVGSAPSSAASDAPRRSGWQGPPGEVEGAFGAAVDWAMGAAADALVPAPSPSGVGAASDGPGDGERVDEQDHLDEQGHAVLVDLAAADPAPIDPFMLIATTAFVPGLAVSLDPSVEAGADIGAAVEAGGQTGVVVGLDLERQVVSDGDASRAPGTAGVSGASVSLSGTFTGAALRPPHGSGSRHERAGFGSGGWSSAHWMPRARGTGAADSTHASASPSAGSPTAAWTPVVAATDDPARAALEGHHAGAAKTNSFVGPRAEEVPRADGDAATAAAAKESGSVSASVANGGAAQSSASPAATDPSRAALRANDAVPARDALPEVDAHAVRSHVSAGPPAEDVRRVAAVVASDEPAAEARAHATVDGSALQITDQIADEVHSEGAVRGIVDVARQTDGGSAAPADGRAQGTAVRPGTAMADDIQRPDAVSTNAASHSEGSADRRLRVASRALHRALGLDDGEPLRPAESSVDASLGSAATIANVVNAEGSDVWRAAAQPSFEHRRGPAQPEDGRAASVPTLAVSAVGASASLAQMTRAADGFARLAGSALGASEGLVMPQIVQAMRVQMRNGVGEARVQLEPEHLGAVTVALRIEHGRVTATITADAPDVRRWIDGHQSMLRDALADQGLELTRFVVNPDSDPPEREPREPEPSPRRRRGPRVGESGPVRFEVLV
jgi:flagellar hook-length control protein FliK